MDLKGIYCFPTIARCEYTKIPTCNLGLAKASADYVGIYSLDELSIDIKVISDPSTHIFINYQNFFFLIFCVKVAGPIWETCYSTIWFIVHIFPFVA